MGHSESPEEDFVISEQQAETSTVLLDDVWQGRGEARIVQAQSLKDLNLDAEVNDALAGDGWSDDSKALFQQLYADAANKGIAPIIFVEKLILVAREINHKVKSQLEKKQGRLTEPVDVQPKGVDGNAFEFYVILSKDQKAKDTNQKDVNNGNSSRTVIKLGPLSIHPAQKRI